MQVRTRINTRINTRQTPVRHVMTSHSTRIHTQRINTRIGHHHMHRHSSTRTNSPPFAARWRWSRQSNTRSGWESIDAIVCPAWRRVAWRVQVSLTHAHTHIHTYIHTHTHTHALSLSLLLCCVVDLRTRLYHRSTRATGTLACKFVLHTVGPNRDLHTEREGERLLARAYIATLNEAVRLKCQSVGLVNLSCGAYRWDSRRAAHIALQSVRVWMNEHAQDQLLTIVFCCFRDWDWQHYAELMPSTYFP